MSENKSYLNYNKPLGQKSYGSIGHLHGSRLGEGDRHISSGQQRIATEKARDKHDIVIVQEKLDGSNVGVAKIGGKLFALTRGGYLANDSTYPTHLQFYEWFLTQKDRFKALLLEDERICGEWLGQAIGTRYNLKHEPFVAFDIMRKHERLIHSEFMHRVNPFDIITPRIMSIGEPFSIDSALDEIKTSGHGAIDNVEGAIWRVERKGKVDFLAKYVRHDYVNGRYFPENNNGIITWNWHL